MAKTRRGPPAGKARRPRAPRPAEATARQRLTELLREGERSFGELARELVLRPAELEEHLRHVQRSARGEGADLVIVPAACRACGYEFRDRDARHLHAPGRCPVCRSERIAEPRFRLEPR